jgi:hypothetical protein
MHDQNRALQKIGILLASPCQIRRLLFPIKIGSWKRLLEHIGYNANQSGDKLVSKERLVAIDSCRGK